MGAEPTNPALGGLIGRTAPSGTGPRRWPPRSAGRPRTCLTGSDRAMEARWSLRLLERRAPRAVGGRSRRSRKARPEAVDHPAAAASVCGPEPSRMAPPSVTSAGDGRSCGDALPSAESRAPTGVTVRRRPRTLRRVPASFHTSRLALDQLVDHEHATGASLDRNEATTRLQLVDALLFDILGWTRDESAAEEAHAGRYTDYTLGLPDRRLVVEAKREDIAFELPVGQKPGVVPIRTLLDGDALEAAIRQALGYAQERGVPFAAVANGHQLVAFIASRQDGVPPLTGKALVFTSLEDMRSNFRLLWDNLSREGTGSLRLHRTLKDSALPVPPPKLSEQIPNYPRFRRRNQLQADLQILSELFLEDLFQAEESLEVEFLKECYAQSGALSQYAMVSKEILRTRYSALMSQEAGADIEPATPRGKDSGGIASAVVASALSKRPIVLLGDVGVGKTMFIRHLTHVAARDIFGDVFSLYIDFVAEPAFATDLGQYVSRQLSLQLMSKYDIDIEESKFVQGMYRSELQRFDSSVLGQLKEIDPAGYERERIRFLQDRVKDVDNHIRAAFEHIVKVHRRQIVVFLDNIDQRPSEFQEEVYVMAHAMAERWPATVFVSLRPSTFFTSKRRGSLSAYPPRVFAISPPRIDVVLKRRIAFALAQLERTGGLAALPDYVELNWPSGIEDLASYLRVLLNSFDVNQPLVAMLDNLSGGNVRQALGFVRTFVGSGNVDTEKILERSMTVPNYTVKVHQFLRAILLGDHQDFSPEASVIANVFDLLTPDGREHFLLPLLLSEVRRLSEHSQQEGYVRADQIYEFGQRAGFGPVQISWALERCVAHGLLEVRPLAPEGSTANYRITSTGAYTVGRLPRMFAYLDAVVVDTPIVDSAMRSQIHDAQAIDDRLSRAELFRVYLDKQWNGFSDEDFPFDWTERSAEAHDNIMYIGRMVAGWP